MIKELRTYTDLCKLKSFEERLEYLRLSGVEFEPTFGSLRHLNQRFYSSQSWRSARNAVIMRDDGRDLAFRGYEIVSNTVYVHHMNPIDPYTLEHQIELALDPEYLITVSERTHRAIHFGINRFDIDPVVRIPGDTKLW